MKLDEINILYHGTGIYHEQIDLSYSAPLKDFGYGYYVTSHRQQAVDWAQRKGRRRKKCWVFEYALSPVPKRIKIKELLQYNQEWLDFVVKHRLLTEEEKPDFDIVYDRMADTQFNALSTVLQKYVSGNITSQRALNRIRFRQNDKDQYCFKTPAAVRLLNRIRTHTYRLIDGKWREEL